MFIPYSTQSPFIALVLVELIPYELPLPGIDYYGTGNPKDHIVKFVDIMHLTITNDAISHNNGLITWRQAQYQISDKEFNKIVEQINGQICTTRGKTTLHPAKDKGKKEFIEAKNQIRRKPKDFVCYKHYSLLNEPKNKSRWCNFHNDYGHTTTEYRSLKDNQGDLMQRCYYYRFKARKKIHPQPRG
ncbi:hypothetical protein Cgig2_011979 [Carnegiea gigantea]|uniref:Uncharacterized protein n=1 Tax=Carnegiea gigantea TaxID=171969 RepID=A0A9Q1GRY1_9CARY|nr:hypothetical protein Cgig2_011979 [Carnegiea gigantea]